MPQGEVYLIDTSAWLFALRKGGSPLIKGRVDDLLGDNSAAITGIVKVELLGGTKTEAEFARLKMRLDSLVFVQSDPELWDGASSIAFSLRKKGITVPYTDIVIAACALKENAVLLHADRHFEMVKKHIGLKTENYADKVR